jgi:hypothetical protein
MPRRAPFALASLLLLVVPAGVPRLEGDGEPLEIEVVDAAGAVTHGRWKGLGKELELVPRGAEAPKALPLTGLRDARFPGTEAPAGDVVRATLVGGEVLRAERLEPAPDGVTLSSKAFGSLRVPFEALRSLEPIPARAGLCHEPAGRLAARPGSDRVALTGGDELGGTVVAAEVEGLRVEVERGRERVVPWTELLVALLDNPCPPPAPLLRTEVETLAGDLLVSTGQVRGDATSLQVPLVSEATLMAVVPLAQVRAIRWRGGPNPCVDATTLAFTSATVPLAPTPESLAEFVAHDSGVRVGRRPRGCPLRLDGTTYVHGFAVHSGSTITLPLDGLFARFDALVGIDDEAEELGRGNVAVPGDVDVRVLGDGKVLWEAKGVAGLESARKVGPIDVRGVKSLVLAVDYGGHDTVLDRTTWADPVLTR